MGGVFNQERVSTKIEVALTSLYIVLVESIFDESKKAHIGGKDTVVANILELVVSEKLDVLSDIKKELSEDRAATVEDLEKYIAKLEVMYKGE